MRATITDGSDKEIHIPSDLDFLERKLDDVKNKSEKRAKDSQEAEQRKNDLVVYLAHDIKTALTSIIGYLSFWMMQWICLLNKKKNIERLR
ncbi:UNVERIFIED_CONTAM: hypothetical protein BJ099_10115 [Lysinibacillus xylanilyticus]